MDINGLLEQTWNNPPEPNNFGCARKALIPFFKLMQITGCYHEYRHFQELDKVTREKAKAAHNEDQKKKIQYPLDSPEGACYRRLSKYRQFEQKMITESYNGQGNIRIKAMMKSDENEDVQTCRGDMLYLYTVGVPDGTNQFEESGSYFKRLVDGWRKRTPNPLGHPESFLNRCAMVPSEATKDEVLQLGAKWDPEVGSEVNATTDASRSWFSAVFSDRVFSFLVVCILWANLFRCAIYVGGRETVDTFHVVACGSWYFMSASTCTVMFVTCAKKSYFREFFWKWGTIYTDPVTKQLGLHGVITTGFTKWVIAFQWGAILFNLFAIASIMIFSDYLFTDGMSKIFYITGQRSIPWLIASILVHFFVSCSWLSPTAFIVVMCHHIVQHFEALNMVIKLHVGAAKSRFPQHLALLRERHLAMCETVEVMDRCISKLSIFIYGTTIGLCCFNVYYVFTGTLDKSLIPVFLFWFFSNFGIMTLVTYHTSNVNVAMHSVGSYLHLIQTKDLTPDQLGQLQMFLFKTTGPSMGFTVLGMVTVTKELMMTLIGALLTYTVILLQFN